jgi:two-component system response regulator AtoC
MSKQTGLKILLIEPSDESAIGLQTLFGKDNHSISIVKNKSAAATSIKESSFDLVLEDITEFVASDKESDSPYQFSNIISNSPAMQEIFETVKRLTNFKTTILISGESGTGKELLARAIHCNSSRAKSKFVAINCGAIPENLIESELFGHKMGSFTDAVRDRIGLFEEADGGTVFLDEIGELPLHLQVKLLRVLQDQTIRRIGEEQDKKIDVRILAASHKNLEDAVRQGSFREDLLYRLNVVHIHLPALRDRREDIEVLIDHLIKKHNKKMGTFVRGVSSEVMDLFKRYPWRGNIRELENTIERGLVLSDSDLINLECLPDKMRNPIQVPEGVSGAIVNDEKDANLSIKQRVRELETELISRALGQTKGNRTHAAKLLEISHRTLLYKLKEYGLSEE